MQPDTEQLLRQFKALGDPQRLRLLALCRQGECSVSELTNALGQSQPRVSQQVKQLCDAGLLERFRDGKHVYYRLPGSRDGNHRRLLALVPDDDPQFREDAARLRELRGGDLADAGDAPIVDDALSRAIQRVILDQTVTAPIGDLLDVGCDFLTLGQYLQHSPNHLPVVRYLPPEEFDDLGEAARRMGFRQAASGPFVRSSYHAREMAEAE